MRDHHLFIWYCDSGLERLRLSRPYRKILDVATSSVSYVIDSDVTAHLSATKQTTLLDFQAIIEGNTI